MVATGEAQADTSHILKLKGENQQWMQGDAQTGLGRLKDNFAISPGDVSLLVILP